MALYVDGSWTGWSGDTLIKLTDGSVWQQAEYYYEYSYAYRPKVIIDNEKMSVQGTSTAVRVRRVH